MLSKNLSVLFLAPKEKFIPALLKKPSIATKLNRIYTHTFNEQLFEGTLNAPSFGQYLHDDYIYLHSYALVLNKLAARIALIKPALSTHLNYLSSNIIACETQMQEQYKEYFTYTAESQPGKAINHYIDFLDIHAEHSDIPTALCSILPCFWIYYTLGARTLHPNQLDHNPYKSWIKTYSDPDFVNATLTLTDAINALAVDSNDMIQANMSTAFEEAIDHELAFFDEVDPINQFSQASVSSV